MMKRPNITPLRAPTEAEINEFCYAARGDDLVLVALLLTTYGNTIVNARGDYQMTALCWAAREGHVEIMRLLLENGADIDAPDLLMMRTPLGWAAFQGQNATIRLLLEHGAAAHKQDIDGHTAAGLARWMGHMDSAQIIEQSSSEKTLQKAVQDVTEKNLQKLRSQRLPNPFKKKDTPKP